MLLLERKAFKCCYRLRYGYLMDAWRRWAFQATSDLQKKWTTYTQDEFFPERSHQPNKVFCNQTTQGVRNQCIEELNTQRCVLKFYPLKTERNRKYTLQLTHKNFRLDGR